MVWPSAIAFARWASPRSSLPRDRPGRNPYAERLIGSICRECLDHVIIFSERHLRRVLSSYFQYHHEARTHLSLNKDCPRPRPVQLPSAGHIIAFPAVGGLHHRYERRAARDWCTDGAKSQYEIGYGKPPRHTRFQKGQSGNPRGRKRGSVNTEITLRKHFSNW